MLIIVNDPLVSSSSTSSGIRVYESLSVLECAPAVLISEVIHHSMIPVLINFICVIYLVLLLAFLFLLYLCIHFYY